jgi:hypothetical protein
MVCVGAIPGFGSPQPSRAAAVSSAASISELCSSYTAAIMDAGPATRALSSGISSFRAHVTVTPTSPSGVAGATAILTIDALLATAKHAAGPREGTKTCRSHFTRHHRNPQRACSPLLPRSAITALSSLVRSYWERVSSWRNTQLTTGQFQRPLSSSIPTVSDLAGRREQILQNRDGLGSASREAL